MKTRIGPNLIQERLRLKSRLNKEDIKLIIRALPINKVNRNCRYLPNLLQFWYLLELIEHSRFGPDTKSSRLLKDIKEIGQLTRRLSKTLATPDGEKLRDVVFSETWEAKCITPSKNDLVKADAEIDQFILSASMIEEAANRYVAKKRKVGRPQSLQSLLVMRDIAAIYGWVTDTQPTRQFDPVASEEMGPFFNFASACWIVIYGNDDGLPSAMKPWARDKRNGADPSAIVFNFQHSGLESPLWWKLPPE